MSQRSTGKDIKVECVKKCKISFDDMNNLNLHNDTPTETVTCYNKCTFKNINSTISTDNLVKHIEELSEEQSLKLKECLTESQEVYGENDFKKRLLQCFALAGH